MGACLSSPYLAPLVLPIRHAFRSCATNLSKDLPLKFSGEITHRQSGALNYFVWRRSALFMTVILQLVCIVFTILDASGVNGAASRAALTAVTADGAAFTTSCTSSCTAMGSGTSEQAAYDTVCPDACATASGMMETEVATAVTASYARRPESCSNPVDASNDVDTLRVLVGGVQVAGVGLSMLLALAASCHWSDHPTSAKCVTVAFVLRIAAPFVVALLPWFSFMDFECPQFRAYSALAVIAPLLSVALTLAPGLVRGSRLIGTVVPKSAVPTMLLRISPALHVIAMGTAVSVLAQLLGNVVALIGLVVLLLATLPFCHMSFTIEGTKSGRHLATQTQCYKWSHLFMFAVAAVLLVVYGITKSADLRDALGDVPALLPQVPSANFVVAYAAAYFMDFFLASLLCADFIVGALMLLRNRDGYLERDREMTQLALLTHAGKASNPLDDLPPATGTVQHDNPAHRRNGRPTARAYDVEAGEQSAGSADGADDVRGAEAVRGHRAVAPPHARPSPRRTPRKQRRPSRGGGGGGRRRGDRGGGSGSGSSRGRGRGGSGRGGRQRGGRDAPPAPPRPPTPDHVEIDGGDTASDASDRS